ncbi:DUF4153 domain-containing protein [Falsirhodobacter halotolerans]|uniref:DUF4153 domain-containing protein n=1 Tax=Falsirhodobacter halotolerans TaxID=1146892 RepID=UPI001FD0D504|nr:DUF4153 domain-containing protein [Falsirhodobacter halotolerans]MCJ8140156.1 DUF4153 domain-containing protein [Falsirhodobacter halotolerans]
MGTAIGRRLALAFAGALAGTGFWLLEDYYASDLLTARQAMLIAATMTAFFHSFLAMVGPLTMARSALGAVAVTAPAVALLNLMSLRHGDQVTAFSGVGAFLILILLPLPFWVAAARGRMMDYAVLFQEAWAIVLRLMSGWLFVAVVWGVIVLSSALLGMVGIDVLDRLMDTAVGPWLISGVALGLGIAVMAEAGERVSLGPVLMLLRLLIPVVLVVLGVFLVALPVQGVSETFGTLSAAMTLLAVCAIATTLITTALDCAGDAPVPRRGMRWATQALAVLLPIPAGLAGWSLWLRIADYGWTPQRVLGVTVTALALSYGVAYAGAVLRGPGWAGRIRRANVALALVTIGLAALWMTPVLNAERISANSQAARVIAGADLSERQFTRWGLAGERALADLRARGMGPPARADLAAADAPVTVADLSALMPVRPPGAAAARDRILGAVDDEQRRLWHRACLRDRRTDGRVGCLMIVANFLPDLGGDQAVILSGWQSTMVEGMVLKDGVVERLPVEGSGIYSTAPGALAAYLEGEMALTPRRQNEMRAGDFVLRLSR